MANIVVVGVQWGDEGKGKIVDLLAKDADVVVRFQGGSNAGHTVEVGGERFILHLIPSGVLHSGSKCVIAAGVVVDPEVLVDEISQLKQRGYLQNDRGLVVSDRAQIVLPYHKKIDLLREQRLGINRIGTTGRGIGPAYEDRVARRGILFCEFIDPAQFRRRLESCLPYVNSYLKDVLNASPYNLEELYQPLAEKSRLLARLSADTSLLLDQEIKKGSNILFEGAQGTLLDVNHGSYPFVTSSSTIAGGALAGAGVGPTKISRVIGVSKAYTTRVGGGPFPSEITGSLQDELREKGREYGATTGRPRRCGWLDAVVGRYAARLNGLDLLAITKLDVLSGLEKVKICKAYNYRGRILTEFPANPQVLLDCQPVYEEMEGWKQDISEARRLEDLPPAARDYLDRLEKILEVKIGLISVGCERQQTIVVVNPFRV